MGLKLWYKAQSEVSQGNLLAYTIGKIQPFEWVTIDMYFKENLYNHPPVFSWRFHHGDEKIYSQLRQCINEYRGIHKWAMFKGPELNSPTKRNYTIEPMTFFEIHKTQGFVHLEKILGSNYIKVCLEAIDDIPSLCKHIEEYFNLSHLKPHLPIPPILKLPK